MELDLKKNTETVVDITGMTHDGNGVGRIGELVVFIPGCVPGDRIRMRIIALKKSYAVGRLLEILSPSPSRVASDCIAFPRCGGCAFRHISYDEELRLKEQRVADAFLKVAHLSVTPDPITASPLVDGYRNKAQYPVGPGKNGAEIGFYANCSHRIVPSDACPLQPPVFGDTLKVFREWIAQYDITPYDETAGKGLLRHIFLRQAEATGEIMACAVATGDTLPHADALIRALKERIPGIASVVLNVNRGRTNAVLGPRCRTLWGKERITDLLCGKKFEISPLSFYQVNRRQAERLYRAAAEFAGGGGLLLDLYCGAGTIGLCLEERFDRIVGVEVVADAVEDAKRNAAINHIEKAEFICADAEQAAAELLKRGTRPDVVVVDPPRKGLSEGTVGAVAAMRPERVVYVSCDPATLARDLAAFAPLGYECVRARPFDMFPRTAHVECVVLITRVEK